MGNVILILTRILFLVASIVCLIWPTRVIAVIYGISKSMVNMFGADNLVDSRTKEATKLSQEDPTNFEDEFPWQVRMMRVSGAILMIMFILSLCMAPPSS